MLDLPAIPYVIFTFILLGGLAIGWKWGWKASLLTIGLTIVSTAISVVLFVLLYPQISNLFEEYIMKNYGNANLDYSEIMEFAKAPIGSIFVSIVVLPILGILLIATIYPRKLLLKHLNDRKVMRLSNNSFRIEKIDTRRVRFTGVLVNSVSAFGMATIAFASTTAVFTPSYKYNWINHTGSSFTYFFTFGQASSPISYQYVMDFLPETKDDARMNALTTFLRPGSTGDGIATPEEIALLNSIGEMAIYDNVFSRSDSTNAILGSLDKTFASGDPWKPLGNQEHGSYTTTTQALYDAYFTVTDTNMGFSTTQANNIINWVNKNTIQDFSTTVWAVEYAEAVEARQAKEAEIKLEEEELSRRQTLLIETYKNIDTLLVEIPKLVSQIDVLVAEHSNLVNVIIPAAVTARDSSKIISDAAEEEYNIANAAYNIANTDYLSKNNTFSNAEARVNATQLQIDRLNSDITELARLIASNRSALDKATEELAKLEIEVQSALSLRNEKRDEYDSNPTDANKKAYDDAAAAYAVKLTEMNHKQVEVDNFSTAIWGYENERESKLRELEREERDLVQETNEMNAAKDLMDAAKVILDEKTSERNRKESIYIDAKSDYDVKQGVLYNEVAKDADYRSNRFPALNGELGYSYDLLDNSYLTVATLTQQPKTNALVNRYEVIGDGHISGEYPSTGSEWEKNGFTKPSVVNPPAGSEIDSIGNQEDLLDLLYAALIVLEGIEESKLEIARAKNIEWLAELEVYNDILFKAFTGEERNA